MYLRLTILISVFVLAISCNQKNTSPNGYEKIKNISKAQLSNYTLIDVRTPNEISKGKILESALEIDYKSSEFQRIISKLDKEQDYLVYCASGGRSSSACKLMTDMGFKSVTNLEGGYSGWRE